MGSVSNQIFAAKPKPGEPWDVCVIGSGPAGLTSAIYTTRGASSTLVIAGGNWGGQLMQTSVVDNFPGFPEGIDGAELMARMRKQAERFGAEIVVNDVESVDFGGEIKKLTAGGVDYLAKSVIIATGASTKWLNIPGEDRLRGRGVSSCAPCDAPFFKNKKVAVIGGGDSAMEEALVLTKYALEVAIIHRREEFKASAAMQERVFKMRDEGKIKIFWNKEILEFKGEKKLEEILIKDAKTGNEESLSFEGVFVAIGHEPSTKTLIGKVNLDEKGYVARPGSEMFATATSVVGVFVAGDVHDYHYKQAITAAGYGCMAALDTLKYLDKETPGW